MIDHLFNERIEFLKREIKSLETANNILYVFFFVSFLINMTLITNMFWS